MTLSNTGSTESAGTIALNGSNLVLQGADLLNTGYVYSTVVSAITGTGTLTNSYGGTIKMKGNIDVAIINAGVVSAIGGTMTLNGNVANNVTGRMEAGPGATIQLANGLATNQGTINLTGGTFDNNGHTLTNTGEITGNGTLKTGGITNTGTVNLWGSEPTAVYGNVTNHNLMNVTDLSATFFDDVTNNGTVTNSGSIIVCGAYTQLAGQTINNGILTQTSIDIQGGSLSGFGTIYGNVAIGSGAWVSPGISPGTLTINGDFASDGNLFFEIGGLDAGQFDVLHINGNASFTGGTIAFDFIHAFHASEGDYWEFLLADNIMGWDTLNVSVDGLGTGLAWEIDAIAGGGRQLLITEVPLPATIWLLGLGLAGLVARSRRIRKSDELRVAGARLR